MRGGLSGIVVGEGCREMWSDNVVGKRAVETGDEKDVFETHFIYNEVPHSQKAAPPLWPPPFAAT